MSAPVAPPPPGWLKVAESGALFGLRFLAVMATLLGRTPVRWLLRVIVFYYALVRRDAMRISADYLAQLQQPHGFWDCYRHILCFAECTTDRFFFIRGLHHFFDIRANGRENLERLKQSGRGAILLGAHLGSFEAMHASGGVEGYQISVVGYFRNARLINEVLTTVGRGVHASLIEVSPGDVSFPLRLRDRIERGELLAILGDRLVGGAEVEVDFLGRKARLPAGVYAIASVLKCPVYLTFGLYHPPNRYELYCELFAERIELPRGNRQEAIARYAQQYADRVAHYCRLAPNNWFNFYDFWSERG